MSRLIRSAIAMVALAGAALAGLSPAGAQVAPTELIVRLERMENQIRQLTGTLEQLQFHNQQLEQQIRRMEEAELARGGPPRPVAAPAPAVRPVGPALPPPQPANAAPQRRSDAFDPSQNPTAAGAPHTLGTVASAGATEPPLPEPPPVGAPGGRAAGAPLNLSSLAIPPAGDGAAPPGPGGALPPPPPRNPNATGVLATLPPSASPRDECDLAYGYVLRKDYALAEETFRDFLKRHPNDRLMPEATYWLGETLFQRQRYRDAAELFLAVTRDHATAPKAPDAMLRLGQSLALLGERDAACGTLAAVGTKYPRASLSVKQGVDREQKRVRC